jgi:hypothetical protein
MLEPNVRLKGEAVKTLSGIVHFLALKTTVLDPSQLANSVMKLSDAVLNVTKNFVSGEPFAKGATQVTSTVLFFIVVIGASGRSGLNALRIVTLFDCTLRPNMFLDATLKL